LLSASESPGRALQPIVEAARTVLDIQYLSRWLPGGGGRGEERDRC